MAKLRVKGQEARLVVSGPDGSEESVTAHIKSMSASMKQEILEENYLGNVTSSFDDIFHGIEGEMEWDTGSPETFRFLDKIRARAQRRGLDANTVFNLSVTLTYPSGRLLNVIFKDVSFGDIDLLDIGGRAEFVGQKLSFACEEYRLIYLR